MTRRVVTPPRPVVKRHSIGRNKPCPCGFVHYVNPQRSASGVGWKCAVCGDLFSESQKEEARQHAIADHRKRLKGAAA
jgi:hypothetical protein